MVRALEPGRLAPAACGEQKPTQLMLYGKTGPPPHVRGTVFLACLHLGKSPFHANFAMSATLASAVRIPPCYRGFPPSTARMPIPVVGRQAGREPRRHGRSLCTPLGAGDGLGRSLRDPSPYR